MEYKAIQLLDESERRGVTEDIRISEYRTDKVHIPSYIAYQGEGEIKESSGRATCRFCGNKIAKGEKEISFFYSEDGNSWTSKEYHICLNHIAKVEK